VRRRRGVGQSGDRMGEAPRQHQRHVGYEQGGGGRFFGFSATATFDIYLVTDGHENLPAWPHRERPTDRRKRSIGGPAASRPFWPDGVKLHRS
jgi:hypothetical protein